MELTGLITVTPDQTDLIEEVAIFMGESFMEEMWTSTYLGALGEDEAYARKLEVSQAMMRGEFSRGGAHGCAYTLPDCAGAFLGYRGSELKAQGVTWTGIEEEGHVHLASTLLTPEETSALHERSEKMEPISYFGWGDEEAAEYGFDDYIYFAAWAVNPTKRGSGAFRRLTNPVFEYADEHRLPCFLECYADHLISLYEHVGFKTFRVFETPEFPIKQTCMVRLPR